MRAFIRKNRGLAALLALISIAGMLTTGTHALFTASSANEDNDVATDELTAADLHVPSASGANVSLDWDAASLGNSANEGDIRYFVERKLAGGSFEAADVSCTNVAGTDCTDTVSAGGAYTYRVIAKFRTWTAESNARSITIALGDAPDPPESVALANGGGVGNAYINAANRESVDVDVVVPAASGADTVHVKITRATAETAEHDVPATAGTVSVDAIDSSELADGAVTIRAWTENAFGPSAEVTTTVTKDTVKPSSEVSAVANITTGTTFAVEYSAGDPSPSSTLDKVELFVDDPAAGGLVLVPGSTDTSPSSAGSLSYTAANQDGTYGFATRAYDKAGNVEDTPVAAHKTATRVTGTPPTVETAVIAKTAGAPNSIAGYVRANGTYRVYADVSAGTSAVESVTADLSSISGSASAGHELAACSSAAACTINGETYDYVSAAPATVLTGTSDGDYGFSVTATDSATRSHTVGSPALPSVLDVTVDNQALQGASLAADGDNDNLIEAGETITFGYSTGIDGQSLLGTWVWPFATTSDVRVTIVNNSPGNDTIVVSDATDGTVIPFGSLTLSANNFVTGSGNVQFGGPSVASASTMSIVGSTVVLKLGTRRTGTGSTGTLNAPSGNRTLSWTPTTGSGAAYNRAGTGVTANGSFATPSNERVF